MNQIKELQVEFTRKGWKYLQIERNNERYLYQVTTNAGHVFYEVFARRINTRYNCVSYPGDESFGVWAKCVNSLEKARYYLDNGFKRVD